VIDYESELIAEEVRLTLLKMQKEYLIDLVDAVVVVRDERGKVRLRQLYNLTATGDSTGPSRWLIATSCPHAAAAGWTLTDNTLASPIIRLAAAGPCSAVPHALLHLHGRVTWSVPTTRPTMPIRGRRTPGRSGMISRSWFRRKSIPAADPWKSDPTTADRPMLTTMVFGSRCSTWIDPPPVWTSLVRIGVTSAFWEWRTIW
jgi:hypothetical protein